MSRSKEPLRKIRGTHESSHSRTPDRRRVSHPRSAGRRLLDDPECGQPDRRYEHSCRRLGEAHGRALFESREHRHQRDPRRGDAGGRSPERSGQGGRAERGRQGLRCGPGDRQSPGQVASGCPDLLRFAVLERRAVKQLGFFCPHSPARCGGTGRCGKRVARVEGHHSKAKAAHQTTTGLSPAGRPHGKYERTPLTSCVGHGAGV